VVWNRVPLPDTSSLTLDNLISTVPAGYAGLEEDVGWHWNRIAGAALITLLGAGAKLAAPENAKTAPASSSPDATTVSQIGQEITRCSLNIQSTPTARPDLPMRIIVNKGLLPRPHQPLFFSRGVSQ